MNNYSKSHKRRRSEGGIVGKSYDIESLKHTLNVSIVPKYLGIESSVIENIQELGHTTNAKTK